MDGRPENKPPLNERIRQLADELAALRRGITEELDWREELRARELDDWNEDGEEDFSL
ncbi:MAG TPA: hypothetical protein VKT72_04115 [Candidatus Baltobacteraceae bacterium]|nr:hypothetical protein [Candidatus Baltobacteraceae bacterium]